MDTWVVRETLGLGLRDTGRRLRVLLVRACPAPEDVLGVGKLDLFDPEVALDNDFKWAEFAERMEDIFGARAGI